MFVYNQRGKGKVHLFKAHHSEAVQNPDLQGDRLQVSHWIYLQCTQSPFRWTYSYYKSRDFGKDYVLTEEMPDGRVLCKNCQIIFDSAIPREFPTGIPNDSSVWHGWLTEQRIAELLNEDSAQKTSR